MLKFIVCCICNLCAVLYVFYSSFCLITFLSGNRSGLLHKHSKSKISYHVEDFSVYNALMSDGLYLMLFIASHSILASHQVKTIFNIGNLYRTFYITVTSYTLQMVMEKWKVIFPEDLPLVWNKGSSDTFVNVCQYVHIAGWLITMGGIFVLDYSEFIGCKQVWLMNCNPTNCITKSHAANVFLSHLRHPMLSGFFLVLWLVPCMTIDRFLLASVLTLYPLCSSKLTKEDFNYLKRMTLKKDFSLGKLSHDTVTIK